MLIIAGHLEVEPARRDDFIAGMADLVRRARQAPGCLGVAITADPLEPGWVWNYEHWSSVADLRQWRAVADAPELGIAILDAEVHLYDATGQRDPFDLGTA